jgi:hypothetical protein
MKSAILGAVAVLAAAPAMLVLSCSDDDKEGTGGAGGTATTSTTKGPGGSGGDGGGEAGMGGSGGQCVHCGAVLLASDKYGPDSLCPGEPTMLFGALFGCTCNNCKTQCADPCAMKGPPNDVCKGCIGMSCGAEAGACIQDCPKDTPGCDMPPGPGPGAGGAGGAGGGTGGTGG